MSRAFSAASAMAPAASRPVSPVHALAIWEFMTMPRSRPGRSERSASSYEIGAARTRFCVKTPAQEHDNSLTSTPTSGVPSDRSPADAAPAEKPVGDVMLPSGSVVRGGTGRNLVIVER